MAETAKAKTTPTNSEEGCKCGVPGCQGHEPDAKGFVHIENHPDGPMKLDMSKWAEA